MVEHQDKWEFIASRIFCQKCGKFSKPTISSLQSVQNANLGSHAFSSSGFSKVCWRLYRRIWLEKVRVWVTRRGLTLVIIIWCTYRRRSSPKGFLRRSSPKNFLELFRSIWFTCWRRLFSACRCVSIQGLKNLIHTRANFLHILFARTQGTYVCMLIRIKRIFLHVMFGITHPRSGSWDLLLDWALHSGRAQL